MAYGSRASQAHGEYRPRPAAWRGMSKLTRPIKVGTARVNAVAEQLDGGRARHAGAYRQRNDPSCPQCQHGDARAAYLPERPFRLEGQHGWLVGISQLGETWLPSWESRPHSRAMNQRHLPHQFHLGLCSMLKRSIGGTHIHVSRHHLPKYPGESEFRWNDLPPITGSRR